MVLDPLPALALGLIAVLLPLLSALLPGRDRPLALLPLAAVPALLLALLAPSGSVDLPGLFLGARFGLGDGMRGVLLFSALLWLAAGLHACGYLRDDPRRDRFRRFWCAALTGNIGLLLAQDMASFAVCFTLMGLSAYGLVVHAGTPAVRRAGRVYLALVVLGEVLLFAAIVLLWQSSGSLLFADLHRVALAPAEGTVGIAFACVVLAFGIKAGLLPLHVWLPLAHPAAPTPASAVLSGAMIKAGLVGWLHFLPAGGSMPIVSTIGEGLLAAGLLGAFAGVVLGLLQREAKAALAYSSISQMGLITVAVGAALARPESAPALLAAALLYAFHHGLAKAGLFLGVSLAGAGSQAWRRLWWAGMVLMALSLAGAPFTSGQLAKTALKSALPADWTMLPLLLGLAASGTLLLMARSLALMHRPDAAPRRSRPWSEWLGWSLLLGLGMSAAFWLTPGAGFDGQSLWPLLLGALVLLLALAIRRHAPSIPLPRVPPGDLLALAPMLGRGLRRWWPRDLAARPAPARREGMPGWRRAILRLRRAEPWLARHVGVAAALLGLALAAAGFARTA